MVFSARFIRFGTLALLCALAGGTASVGAASGGRPPDVRDAAAAVNVPVPDAFERYAAAHPYGGTVAIARPPDIADVASALEATVPDVFERAVLRAAATQSLRPDNRPGPLGMGEPTFVPSSGGTGFHWGDWAIGLVAGIGVALGVAGVLVLMSNRGLRRIGAAATR